MNYKKYKEDKHDKYMYLKKKGFNCKQASRFCTYSWKTIKSMEPENFSEEKIKYDKWFSDLKEKLGNRYGYTTGKK